MDTENPPVIAITLDLEWSPDPVLEDALELLDCSRTDATLFSTHEDPFTDIGYERALHPHFGGDNEEAVLDRLHELYPEAVGLRSHRLYIHSPLRAAYVERGIKYESNYMAYMEPNIVPFDMPEGTVQFPVYWMDDVWFRYDGNRIDIESMLDVPGLKVFDFHPPHICFNTPSQEFYNANKAAFWEPTPDIAGLRYEGYGVRDIFKELLDYLDTHNVQGLSLFDMYERHRNGEFPDAE